MSKILKAVHDMAKDLYDAGAIGAVTMREFDVGCLEPPKEFTGKEIKKIRNKLHVSQAVFAKLLNVHLSTVRQWEIEEKPPRGIAKRMLQLVEHEGMRVFDPIQLTEERRRAS